MTGFEPGSSVPQVDAMTTAPQGRTVFVPVKNDQKLSELFHRFWFMHTTVAWFFFLFECIGKSLKPRLLLANAQVL
jgi:hypothetical protein